MRIVLAGHVARIGQGRNAYRILVGKSEGKRRLGALRNRLGECGLNWSSSCKRQLAGFYKHSNEISDFITCREYLSRWGNASFSTTFFYGISYIGCYFYLFSISVCLIIYLFIFYLLLRLIIYFVSSFISSIFGTSLIVFVHLFGMSYFLSRIVPLSSP
jgi:hypothetical protein